MSIPSPSISSCLVQVDAWSLLCDSSGWVKDPQFPEEFLYTDLDAESRVVVEWSRPSDRDADPRDRIEDSPFSVEVLVENGQRLPGLAFLLEREHPGADGVAQGSRCSPHNINLVRGVLWHACTLTVDQLFEDIAEYPDGIVAPQSQWWTTRVLSHLPRRFVDRYNGLFVRKFLTAVVDLTHSLTNGWAPVPALAPGWTPVPTVAHGLAVRVLLDKAAQLAEIFEVDMPAGWRQALEDNLCGDLDLTPLYRNGEDETRVQQDTDVLDFANWFAPRHPQQQLPPFLAA